MKKTIFTFMALSFFALMSFSQVDTKKTNFYSETQIGEVNSVILSVNNPVARFNFSKFGLRIENNSFDYIFFKQEESVFSYDEGNFSPKKRGDGLLISPQSKKTPTLKVDNGTVFLVNEFEFTPSGMYVFPEKGEPLEAEDFHLPATKNNFKVGDFEITMTNIKKQTDETAVQFMCIYKGSKIGIISPANASVRTQDGTLWANAHSKAKTKVLFKGDKVKFMVIYKIPGKIFDMQFAEMDIVWKDVFSDTEMKKVDFPSVKIILDDVKTAEKNK